MHIFFKKLKRMEIFQIHFTKPSLLWHQSQKKEITKSEKREKLQANILDGHRWKNPQQNNSKSNSNQIERYIGRIIQHNQVKFIPGMQGWFNIHQTINLLYHINKMKNKNHAQINRCRKKLLTKSNIYLY